VLSLSNKRLLRGSASHSTVQDEAGTVGSQCQLLNSIRTV